MFADSRQGVASLVLLLCDRDVGVAEDSVARRHAGPSQDAEDGGAVDAELFGEGGSWFASQVPIRQLGTLRIGQSGLLLADRWDGSMGRSVTPLTSENAV